MPWMNYQTHIEIRHAIKSLKVGKAAGPDDSATEFYQEGGTIFVAEFMEVIRKIWDAEEVPQVLKNANIVTI